MYFTFYFLDKLYNNFVFFIFKLRAFYFLFILEEINNFDLKSMPLSKSETTEEEVNEIIKTLRRLQLTKDHTEINQNRKIRRYKYLCYLQRYKRRTYIW